MAQLLALEPWWSKHERLWVTFDTLDAVSLLAHEQVAWAHHPVTRNLKNLFRNLVLARRVSARSGPTSLSQRAQGLQCPSICSANCSDTDRLRGGLRAVDTRSLTGQLCRPLTDLFLVQWPEQALLYPEAKVIGRLLMTAMLEMPRLPFTFVTVGTDHHPFDRLVNWVDSWTTDGEGRHALVKVEPRGCRRSRRLRLPPVPEHDGAFGLRMLWSAMEAPRPSWRRVH